MRFTSRLTHPPTLALIKHLTSLPSLPAQVEYISPEGLKALKEMPLVNRGRLSTYTLPLANNQMTHWQASNQSPKRHMRLWSSSAPRADGMT